MGCWLVSGSRRAVVLLPVAAYGTVAVLWQYRLVGICRRCFILLKPGFPCDRAADR